MSAATWMNRFLAPTTWLLNEVVQVFGNIVNLRNGFETEITTNDDGIKVLNIDVDVANAVYDADPDTIPLRNGSGALKATTFTGTAFTYSTPLEIRRVAPTPLHEQVGWTLDASQNPESDGTGGDAYWRTEIDPPHGSTLTQIRARVFPQVLARAGLPGVPPRLVLWTTDESGVLTEVDYQDDTSANVGEYETAHDITLTISATVDRESTRYLVGVRPEDGENAASGLVLLRPCVWTATVASIAP